MCPPARRLPKAAPAVTALTACRKCALTPSLAGQPDEFVQWQLVYFRSGARKSDVMRSDCAGAEQSRIFAISAPITLRCRRPSPRRHLTRWHKRANSLRFSIAADPATATTTMAFARPRACLVSART